MNEENLDKLFQRAARSALVAWKGDYSGDEDLSHSLWVWYLESPSVQKKLNQADPALAQTLVREHALKILKEESVSYDLFSGRNLYSAESVKDALKGVSTNKYLMDILSIALEGLEAKNEGYAEALRSRYEDGIRPKGAASDELLHAHRAITEQVNIIAITAGIKTDDEGKVLDKEGPGSRNAVFPETRKAKGNGHSDPTADMAISLIEGGDIPIPLNAIGPDGLPLKIGRTWVDGDQTTTLRKEFMS